MSSIRSVAIALGVAVMLSAPSASLAGPSGGGGGFVRADLDGDGDDDILLRNVVGGELGYWLIQDGAIQFGGALIGIPSSFEIQAVGKINGDNIDDLVVRDSATGEVFAWLMTFNGGTNAVTIDTGTLVGDSAGFEVRSVGQFNPGTDGIPDLLLQDPTTSTIAVWYLNADGSFQDGGAFGDPGTNWTVVSAADLEGNGVSDIVIRNLTAGEIGFWETLDGSFSVNRGSGFGLPATFNVLGASADFNDDTIDDIVLQDDAGNVSIWFMFSDGATAPTIDSSVSVGAAGASTVASPGLFNTDAFQDILLVESVGGDINIAAWFLNSGVFIGGGFVGAPPNAFEVSNIGTN